MTGTMVSYLACGGPGHSYSVGLRLFEVVIVLVLLAGLVSLIIGLRQRSTAAKQSPPPKPGYPPQWPGGYPPRPPRRPGSKGAMLIRLGVALLGPWGAVFAVLVVTGVLVPRIADG